MWTARSTAFCRSVGVSVPVIQAPMAGPTTPELVAAVSDAGALGSLPAGFLSADALREQVHRVRALTSHPFAVNVFVPPEGPVRTEIGTGAAGALRDIGDRLEVDAPGPGATVPDWLAGQVEVLLDEGVDLVSSTFGVLPPWALDALAGRGARCIGTATSVAEARVLEERGCVAVVAQGAEAGGHRGSFGDAAEPPMIGSLALTPQVVDAVDCHVVAAGGVMDGRGLAAVLALGAGAAQIGTAFLTTDEAGTDPAWRGRLRDSAETDAVVTRAFSGKAARALANDFTRAMGPHEDEVAGFPAHLSATDALRAAGARRGDGEYVSMWAGQGSPMVRTGDAAGLIAALVAETSACIEGLSRH